MFFWVDCYGNRFGMRGKTLEGGGLGVVLLCGNISCVGDLKKLIAGGFGFSWNLYHHVQFTVA